MSKIVVQKLNTSLVGEIMKSQPMMDYLLEVAHQHADVGTYYVSTSRCNVGCYNPDEELQRVSKIKEFGDVD